jgi:hypothetical protein
MIRPLNVLIGCEESQAVCKEFRRLGHNAFSCDLKPCSGGHPEWHLQMDVFEALSLKKWDFIGLHPTCTKMTLSGNRHYALGKSRHWERNEAVQWTIKLWNFARGCCDSVYMENPMGALNSDIRLPKPQIVQPYYFGDSEQKTTCLWLYGLPMLYHNAEKNLFDQIVTHVDKGEFYEWVDSKTGKLKRQSLKYAQAKGFGGKKTSKDVSETRSKTYPGIAKAMAEQWSEYLMNKLT